MVGLVRFPGQSNRKLLSRACHHIAMFLQSLPGRLAAEMVSATRHTPRRNTASSDSDSKLKNESQKLICVSVESRKQTSLFYQKSVKFQNFIQRKVLHSHRVQFLQLCSSICLSVAAYSGFLKLSPPQTQNHLQMLPMTNAVERKMKRKSTKILPFCTNTLMQWHKQ